MYIELTKALVKNGQSDKIELNLNQVLFYHEVGGHRTRFQFPYGWYVDVTEDYETCKKLIEEVK